MATRNRTLWIGTGVVAAIVLVVAVGVALAPDVNRYTPSIEAAVSQSLGMRFEIRGRAALHLLPRPRLTVRDVHLTNGTSEILAAEEIQISPRWIPLILHRRVSIDRLALRKPQIRIEQPIDIHLRPGRLGSVSVRDGDVSYLSQPSGRSVEVTGLQVRLSGISWGGSDGLQSLSPLETVSLRGALSATSLQIGTLRISEVAFGVKGKDGLVQVDPTEMTLFGAGVRGTLTLDLRGPSPRMHFVQAASRIDLGQVFPGEVQYFSGTVQASVDADGTGADLRAITRTARGHISIRGERVSIHGWDVDQLIEDYNRTQKFNLIDLGAVLVAGPFGPLLTKGADFARLYGGMGQGESEIRTLVSVWEIVNGVAMARDVAFSTANNTVAFQGGVHLVDGNLERFFVATVDHQGCVQVKQRITGSFAHPHAPGLASQSVLGPFESAVEGALHLLGTPDRCDLFYSGSALTRRAESP